MTIHKLSILFVISNSRTRKDGKAPLFCRLTYKKKRKQFAIGLFVTPKHWNNSKQSLKLLSPENNSINRQISLIKTQIDQAFLLLQVKPDPFTVEDIYLQFKGENVTSEKTLMEVFKLHNQKMEKLVGKEYSKATHYKFKEARTHLHNFLLNHHKRNDILLSKITLKFLEDFDYYLKTELGHKQITINKTIQRVRKIIKLALAEGFIEKDPFMIYKPKKIQGRYSLFGSRRA